MVYGNSLRFGALLAGAFAFTACGNGERAGARGGPPATASAGMTSSSAGSAGAGHGGSAGGGSGGTSGKGGSSGASGAPGSSTTVEGFHDAFLDAACDNLLDCTWGGDALDLLSLLQTKEHCRDYFETHYGAALEARLDAVRSGRWTFDPARAAHCLEKLPVACLLFEAEEPLEAFGSVCEEVFEGSVPAGDPCASDEDCAGPATCDTIQDSPACLGRCLPRAEPGSPCTQALDCSTVGGDFAFCSEEQRCVLVTLGAPAALGAACGLLDVTDAGAMVVDCEGEAYCDNREGGTCRPFIAVGAECPSENEPCEAGARCLRDETNALHCVSFDLRKTAGADCSADYVVCDAFSGLACAPSGSCEPSPCNPNLGFGCSAGEFCQEDGTCARQKSVGEPCSFSDECPTGLCAQPASPPNEPHRCLSPSCSSW